MRDRPITAKFPSKSINNSLVGLWRIGQDIYEIQANGRYLVYQTPVPYSINEPQLDWNGWIFDRIYGATGQLAGVWQEPTTHEEFYIRSNGSYTFSDPDGWQVYGMTTIQQNPPKLGLLEFVRRQHLPDRLS
jgi:hypothetical protein